MFKLDRDDGEVLMAGVVRSGPTLIQNRLVYCDAKVRFLSEAHSRIEFQYNFITSDQFISVDHKSVAMASMSHPKSLPLYKPFDANMKFRVKELVPAQPG